MFKFFYNFL